MFLLLLFLVTLYLYYLLLERHEPPNSSTANSPLQVLEALKEKPLQEILPKFEDVFPHEVTYGQYVEVLCACSSW